MKAFTTFGSLILCFFTLAASSAVAFDASNPFRFCTRTGADAADADDDGHVWGADRVHEEVIAAALKVRSSIFSAYTASYITMTQQRDKERCGGSLRGDDPADELIGDRLADIMSRGYLAMVVQCVANDNFDPNWSGFCQDLRDIVAHNGNTLWAAMLSTSTYLSSHMASSLVAVIYDDPFWEQFPDNATHHLTQAPKAVLEARLSRVLHYKPLYDKNNAFLAHHFSTVGQTLTASCYLHTRSLAIGTRLADIVPGAPLVFGAVRDQTFWAALSLARRLLSDPTSHPLLIREEGDIRVHMGDYHPWLKEPAELVRVKQYAREVFTPPASRLIYRALGGLGQAEYEDYLATHPSCALPR